ncbi:hypothetical protein GCM10027436_54620 [Actinophytocola sediminis]
MWKPALRPDRTFVAYRVVVDLVARSACSKGPPQSIMSTPHVHRITKHDPADRDDRGTYRGSEDVSTWHGRI